jgi:hypothetical protein
MLRMSNRARSLAPRRTPFVRARPKPRRGSLQQLRVLSLVDELVTAAAHGHVRLRAAERVVESACRPYFATDWDEIDTVVEFIRSIRGDRALKVNLVGWSGWNESLPNECG